MSPNELELLNRWTSRRDPRAFREITRMHESMVFATCRRILGNAADAEEVAQECFLSLARTNVQVSSSLGGWLHAVATRQSRNRIRGDRRRAERERIYATGTEEEKDTWEEVLAVIDECIAELPDELRYPVVAYFLEEKTQAEISQALRTSQSTVSRKIDKGIEGIRSAVKKRGISVPSAGLATILGSRMTEAAPVALASALGKMAVVGALHGQTEAGLASAASITGGILAMKKTTFALVLLAGLLATLWIAVDRGSESESNESSLTTKTTRVESHARAGLPSESGQGPASPPSATKTVSGVAEDSVPEVAEDSVHETRVESVAKEGVLRPEEEPADAWRGTLAGQVVWGSLGEPAPNQKVRLFSESTDVKQNVETNAAGEFSFVGLESGIYYLSVQRDSVFPERKPALVLLSDGRDRDDVLLRIYASGVIEGQITIGGEPAADHAVEILQWGGGAENAFLPVHTDELGRYALSGILAGDRQFQAILELDGGTSLRSEIVRTFVAADETTSVDLNFMAGTGALEGAVTVNGEPAPGQSMAIYLYDRSGREHLAHIFLETDEESRFHLTNVTEGQISIHAAMITDSGRHIFGEPVHIRTRSNRTTRIDLEFTRGTGSLEGRVTRNGEPVRNGSIIIAAQVVSTDENGLYRVDDVPEGTAFLSPQLRTENGKIMTGNPTEVTIAEGEVTVVNFDFPGGRAGVEGFVFTEEDVPLQATVVAYYVSETGEEKAHFANSRADGYYSITGISPGPAVLWLVLPGGEGEPAVVVDVDLADGEIVQQDIRLPRDVVPEDSQLSL